MAGKNPFAKFPKGEMKEEMQERKGKKMPPMAKKKVAKKKK